MYMYAMYNAFIFQMQFMTFLYVCGQLLIIDICVQILEALIWCIKCNRQ